MAARRSLGGGRILGSGKSLSPAVARNSTLLSPAPNPALLSPSESSVSLSSQTSTTPVSSETEDLTSRVALDDHHGPSAAALASSRLMCPICNEDMVTLLQLNRHLDDNHQNLQEAEQDEVKDWFEQQIKKAKKFQPLAILNQKLKGLDVFESNATPPPPSSTPPPRTGASGHASPAPVPAEPRVVDPDEAVTKTHWQRHTGHDSCSDPLCAKRLNSVNGNVNCRHCGKLFCEEHTMYQMKLSRSAQHEPVRGFWCRVCETCYKSRPGYNDIALERDDTAEFVSMRRRTVDKAYLEVSRLEKRLSRITQLLARPPPPPPDQSTRSYLWSLAGSKDHIRNLEQSIVTWEEDARVSQCPFCQQSFSQYSFRRHHCRTCGRVVCGDPATACSTDVALNVDMSADLTSSEKESGRQVAVDVRMCQECQHTIFSKSDFARSLSVKPPDQRAYENLIQFERGIRLLLPKFQRLLQALQDPDKPPTPTQLADATKVRRRLMDAFTQYDVAARRIRDLPTNGSTAQEKLQKAIFAQATNFLHLHMLPLKSLPKIMKHASPHGLPSRLSHSNNGTSSNSHPKHSQSPLAQIKAEAGRPQPASRTSSASSAQITALEKEEKDLNERLIVLEEQKFFVQEMIADANKRRKFDEVAALSGNVEDLDREIDVLRGRIESMDFGGAYLGVVVDG